jgi:Zn-dependent protease with chaperone function
VLAIGAGLIWAMFAAGHVPVKLVALIAITCLVTVWAMLKSLFVRGVDADPGLRLDLRKHPRVRQVLVEVARRLATAPVENVYMTPGTDVAVMERGGLVSQMRGRPERCLILGVGALEGLRLRPFKAVLAHEYGHLSNKDTAGGGFALAVRRSLLTMARHLGEAGAATWYNPAWWFLNGFFRVFLRISQGASRLQEVLADRWAAFAYGSRALEQGLRHVIEQSVRFDAHVCSTLKEVVTARAPLSNLYAHQPAEPLSAAEVEEAVKAALRAKPTAYDSHPAPADRVAWARALAAPGTPPAADDDDLVWGLFDGRAALEEELTAVVRENIRKAHGIQLAG